MKITNPVLKGFNPDPSICRQEGIIISLYLHLSGFRESRYTTQKI